MYRVYVIVIANNTNNDIAMAQLVNEDRELVKRLRGAGADLGLRRVRRVLEHERLGEAYRPLVIHRYRPKTPLGSEGAGSMLDFRAERIDAFIDQGYADALAHDCGDSQCVLPPDLAERAGLPQ